MNKLKLYLLISFIGFVLFLISFAISWNTATAMDTVYIMTLPFLFVTIAPLVAFAFTPVEADKESTAKKFKLDVLAVFGKYKKNVNISSPINPEYCLSRIS
jgi:hypothetical protein